MVRVDVPSLVEYLHVVIQPHTRRLIVVNEANLCPNVLSEPDGCRVAHTQVPCSRDPNARSVVNSANLTLILAIAHFSSVIRTLSVNKKIALPNVVINVWPLSFVFEPLLVQHIWEPRIVSPVHVNNDGVVRRLLYESFVSRRLFGFRVVRHPNLGIILPYSRNQLAPSRLTDRLSLIDPCHQNACL